MSQLFKYSQIGFLFHMLKIHKGTFNGKHMLVALQNLPLVYFCYKPYCIPYMYTLVCFNVVPNFPGNLLKIYFYWKLTIHLIRFSVKIWITTLIDENGCHYLSSFPLFTFRLLHSTKSQVHKSTIIEPFSYINSHGRPLFLWWCNSY